MATDSAVRHEIGHNPYLSLYVQCDSDEEIEHLYKSLSAGGSTPMPRDSYGFQSQVRLERGNPRLQHVRSRARPQGQRSQEPTTRASRRESWSSIRASSP